jgi:phytoene synthase
VTDPTGETARLRPDDRAACRQWIAHHSKSFYLSSLLLPARVREASWALYAFCRRADDAVDEGADGAEAMRRVEGLRARLEVVYGRGGGADPTLPRLLGGAIDRAYAFIAERYDIPRALPEALLAGMEMDATGARYERWDQLLVYCFRVASTVGLMMTRVMGYRGDVALLRAADLGLAMQLTNIARDVGEDARRGRVYLPAELLDEVGADPRRFAEGPADAAAREAVRRLLARAEAHYRAADLGVPLLPRGCRLAIASSRRIYSAIGAAVAHNGYDSISTRAYVPLARKLLLVLRATGDALGPSTPIASLASVGPDDAALAREIRACGLLAMAALPSFAPTGAARPRGRA